MDKRLSPQCRPLPNLAGAGWLCSAGLTSLMSILDGGGVNARIVGGSVRNAIMGRAVKDIDIATTRTPDEVLNLAVKADMRAIPTGGAHGTVTVITSGIAYEVTTLRRDVETDGRHAIVAYSSDWLQDATRRDFTMNALYACTDGLLFDPLDGLDDVLAQRVRFIGDPNERIREDALRILRFYRFQAEYGEGEYDPAAEAAIELRCGDVEMLSRERVRQEMIKLFTAPGAGRAVMHMNRAGVFRALGFDMPNVQRLKNLLELEIHTPNFYDPLIRLAALLLEPKRGSDAAFLGRSLCLSSGDTKKLSTFEAFASVTPDLSSLQRRQLVCRYGRKVALARLAIAWAGVSTPINDVRWCSLLREISELVPPEFPLKGRDFINIGMEPGPRVGDLLERFETAWIESNFRLERAQLLEQAEVLIKQNACK
jgi:poly(A) polymerase